MAGQWPEEPTLYPFLSARKQLRLLGQLRDLLAAPMEKMTALLKVFGMDDAAAIHQRVIEGHVAGGAGHRALVRDPDVPSSMSRKPPAERAAPKVLYLFGTSVRPQL